MGDFQGHPFRGNQYTAGRAEGIAEGREAGNIRTLIGDALRGADQAARAGAKNLQERLLGRAAGLAQAEKERGPVVLRGDYKSGADAVLKFRQQERAGESAAARERIVSRGDYKVARAEAKVKDLEEKVAAAREKRVHAEAEIKLHEANRTRLGRQIQRGIASGEGKSKLPKDPFEGFRS